MTADDCYAGSREIPYPQPLEDSMARAKGLNAKAREFDNWITMERKDGPPYGEYVGLTGGNHLRYRLRNGEVFSFSNTPSKYTAVGNAKGQVRRLLGVSSDSPKSGKHRKGRSYRDTGYDGQGQRSAYDAYPPEVYLWKERIHQIDDEIREIGPHGNPTKLAKLAHNRLVVAESLEKFGVLVD